MKNTVCFAGFAGDELESLKEALSRVSSAWETTFVADAQAALAALSAAPIDVIVATMRMQGMNGAELLQTIGERHPKTLRFIVSQLTDQAFIIDCINGTHQFIARPFKAPNLASTIQRSLALDALLGTDQLRALAPKLQRLPSLPAIYFEVLKKLESPTATLEDVGKVIARDPAATARLLQVANSTELGLKRKVMDPTDAVSMLGIETVKSLVLCMQVFKESAETRRAGISLDELWRHSLNVGKIAQKIMSLQMQNNSLANDAFTAGLLHDVGRLVLASNLPVEYGATVASARENSCLLHEEETARFGVTHAQVGAYLLGLWGLPAALVEAAGLHHAPGQMSSDEISLLTAVHVADVLAHEQQCNESGIASPTFDLDYLSDLGLADKPEGWRKVLGVAATGGGNKASWVQTRVADLSVQPEAQVCCPAKSPASNSPKKRSIPSARISPSLEQNVASNSTLVGRQLSHYRIVKQLGHGGMGEVYEAEDTQLERRVAIKILSQGLAAKPQNLERFKREARALAALNHPNVVTIYSVERIQNHHFITMELVEGRPLDELIPSGGLSLENLFTYAIPVADALASAHQKGIGHRDLKPANVMVNDQGRVKVIDFGLAKLFEPDREQLNAQAVIRPHMTMQGQILGTPSYMSPEQIEGRTVDHRTDIFSLGVLLWEMATGQRPFLGDTFQLVMASILRDPPPPLGDLKPGLPERLGDITRLCLQKNPNERYQSARDVRNELNQLKEETQTA